MSSAGKVPGSGKPKTVVTKRTHKSENRRPDALGINGLHHLAVEVSREGDWLPGAISKQASQPIATYTQVPNLHMCATV